MKDAKGHGSDKRGMASANSAGNHQRGVLSIGRPQYRVQEAVPSRGVWQTTNVIGGKPIPSDRDNGRSGTSTIAENVARYMRADNRNAAMRASRVAGIQSKITRRRSAP